MQKSTVVIRAFDMPRNPAEVLLYAAKETFYMCCTPTGVVVHDTGGEDIPADDYAAALNRAKVALDFYRAPLLLQFRALCEDWTFAEIVRELY